MYTLPAGEEEIVSILSSDAAFACAYNVSQSLLSHSGYQVGELTRPLSFHTELGQYLEPRRLTPEKNLNSFHSIPAHCSVSDESRGKLDRLKQSECIRSEVDPGGWPSRFVAGEDIPLPDRCAVKLGHVGVERDLFSLNTAKGGFFYSRPDDIAYHIEEYELKISSFECQPLWSDLVKSLRQDEERLIQVSDILSGINSRASCS